MFRKEEFVFSDIDYDDDLRSKYSVVEISDTKSVEECGRYKT